MSGSNIILSDSEREILSEVLENYLSDLGMEISDTDNLDYREKLKYKRTIIRKILKEIKDPAGYK